MKQPDMVVIDGMVLTRAQVERASDLLNSYVPAPGDIFQAFSKFTKGPNYDDVYFLALSESLDVPMREGRIRAAALGSQYADTAFEFKPAHFTFEPVEWVINYEDQEGDVEEVNEDIIDVDEFDDFVIRQDGHRC